MRARITVEKLSVKEPVIRHICNMETYVSLLRGVNVSGHKMLKMADLVTLFKDQGFYDVATYLQSGNVIFRTDKKMSPDELSGLIEEVVLERFKLNVAVIVRTSEDIMKIIYHNPFSDKPGTDTGKLHVTFLSGMPGISDIENIVTKDYSPDKFIIEGKEVFLYCPGGYAKTKLSNTFFENKLRVTATTRNWNTVKKLFELSR